MVLDTSLLKTQQYKARIKGKVEKSRVAPSPTPWCSSNWKGSLLVTLECSRQLYLLLTHNKQPQRRLWPQHCNSSCLKMNDKSIYWYKPKQWISGRYNSRKRIIYQGLRDSLKKVQITKLDLLTQSVIGKSGISGLEKLESGLRDLFNILNYWDLDIRLWQLTRHRKTSIFRSYKLHC